MNKKKANKRNFWINFQAGLLAIIAFLIIIAILDRPLFSFTQSKSANINFGSSKLTFKGSDFYIYMVDRKKENLKLWLDDEKGDVYKNIGNLKKDLDSKGEKLLFATNAGMYKPNNLPQGLFVNNGNLVTDIDTATEGYGNFYLQPNGVFAFNSRSATVSTTKGFINKTSSYKNATQSGPMLVINGKIHPKFNEPSTNKYIRNGVGIDHSDNIIFAYSDTPVNLYHFADLFLNHLNCNNALYLDGAISKVYMPDLSKVDLSGNLGPLIGTTSKKRRKPVKKNVNNLKDRYKVYFFDPMVQGAIIAVNYENEPLHNIVNVLDYYENVEMVINGGSFNSLLQPEGLLILNKNIVSELNLNDGPGNFYLKPNGVLYSKQNKFKICESNDFTNVIKYERANPEPFRHIVENDETLWKISERYNISREQIMELNELDNTNIKIGQELLIPPSQRETINRYRSANVDFAFQAGPLLLEKGNIHSAFNENSSNVNIRNGVGQLPDGSLVFIESKDKVNLFEFATIFKKNFNCEYALCLNSGKFGMYVKGDKSLENLKKENYGYLISVISQK